MQKDIEEVVSNPNEVLDDCMTMFDTAAFEEGAAFENVAAAHVVRARDIIERLEDKALAFSLSVMFSRLFLNLSQTINVPAQAKA